MAVVKFDANTPSETINAGMAFGVLGVLIADAATASDIEIFGIALQNETMKILEDEITKANINYKSIDLMQGTTVEEVSKCFKSNRLWGFSSLNDEEIKDYINKNSTVDFIIHITSFVHKYYSNSIVDTKWMLYNKNRLLVAKIRTRSVDKLSKDLTGEAYFNEIIKLQNKNVKEFIKMLSSIYVNP